MNPEPKNRWIIVTPTICQGDVPAYWGNDSEWGKPRLPDYPITYATQREAWKEIADTQIMKLQEFIDDNTRDDDEEPEFEPEDYVVPCDVHSDGVITTELHGVFYDPRRFLRPI